MTKLYDMRLGNSDLGHAEIREFLVLQQMWKEIAEWRTKIEQQMKEVSNAVRSMQTAKQLTAFRPSSAYYL